MATAVHQASSPYALAETIGTLPHVIKIFASQQGPVIYVWTIVDSFDRVVRDRIYTMERSVFANFPGIKFDFTVIEGDATATISDAKLVFSAR